ncbi:leucine zipper domain-containing protein [Cyanobium sp. Candia 9D4]|uniref:leucine zipper domain-containing protein n=1 Tax=Cyanobium sp. Candia 9D4 TaxID=2823707 RepID=UPI0020CC90C0|nr:leucine zipper domain-containing protein [Cyanobium sp. Candia 9D4]
MPTHPNARLTPIGRERLIRQHLDEGMSLAQLAGEHGIGERTARKWLARFRLRGPTALADRRSVRRTQRRTLDQQRLQQAMDLWHQRCTLRSMPGSYWCRSAPWPGRCGAWAEPAEEPGSQATGAVVAVGMSWLHDSFRHRTAGPVQPCRAPVHW